MAKSPTQEPKKGRRPSLSKPNDCFQMTPSPFFTRLWAILANTLQRNSSDDKVKGSQITPPHFYTRLWALKLSIRETLERTNIPLRNSTDEKVTDSEDQFLSSMFTDQLIDPVSTSCGLNICMNCIITYWSDSEQCRCPSCKEEFTKRPALKVNTTLREVVESFMKNSVLDKPEVLCDDCTGVKQKALRSCLDCGVSFCKSHLESHLTIPRFKIHKLIEPAWTQENCICQKHKRNPENSGQKKTQTENMQTDVKQMIQDRLKKIKEIRQSAKIRKRNTEREVSGSEELFTALMSYIVSSQDELLNVLEENQKAAERQTKELIKELKQEITELKRRETELEQLSHSEDQVHSQVNPSLCRPSHFTTWTNVTDDPHLSVETVRNALSQLQKSLNEELTAAINEKISELDSTELRRVQQYEVDVTLDPDTANPFLRLSGRKQVRFGDTMRNLPDNPKRFTNYCNILGREGFSSGRFYYEVQVRGKTKWQLGLARESVNRKSEVFLKPQDGFWIVDLNNGNEYKAFADPPVLLFLREKPQKVGVFVDYEKGLVSFFDVEARSHIYSFTGQSFTEKLYPFFCPYNNDGGNNLAPLIISPLSHSE